MVLGVPDIVDSLDGVVDLVLNDLVVGFSHEVSFHGERDQTEHGVDHARKTVGLCVQLQSDLVSLAGHVDVAKLDGDLASEVQGSKHVLVDLGKCLDTLLAVVEQFTRGIRAISGGLVALHSLNNSNWEQSVTLFPVRTDKAVVKAVDRVGNSLQVHQHESIQNNRRCSPTKLAAKMKADTYHEKTDHTGDSEQIRFHF